MVLVADIESYRLHIDWISAKMKCEDNPLFLSEKKRVFEENPRLNEPLYYPFFFEHITNPIYKIDKIAFLDLCAIKSKYPKADLEFFEYMKWFYQVAASFLQKPAKKRNKKEWDFNIELTKFVEWFNPNKKYGTQIKIFSTKKYEYESDNPDLDISALEDYRGKDHFVFLPLLTSVPSISIIKKLKNLTGYRESSFNQEKYFLGRQIVKIDDTIKYLTYCQSLAYNDDEKPDDVFTFNSIKFIPNKFSDILIYLYKYDSNNEFFSSNNILHKVYTDCLQKIRTKILLVGGDPFIADKFIEDVQDYLGEDFIYDCGDGDYYLETSAKTIALKNIDKLSNSTLSKLVIELSQEIHKDKSIILHSNKVLENFNPKLFLRVQLPSTENLHEYYSIYFWLMLKQNKMIGFEGTEMESEEALDALSYCRMINELLVQIPTLTEMYKLVQFLKSAPLLNPIIFDADFVTDLENYIEKKFSITKNQEIIVSDSHLNVEYKYDFEFIHRFNEAKEKDYWLIKNNLDGLECEVEYFTSLPLLYLAYIKKYFEITGRTKIDTDILYRDVKKYQNSSHRKMPPKGPKHNIDSAFYSYFHRVNYPHMYDNKPMKKHKADLLELKKNLVKLFQDHYEINAYDSVIKDNSLFNLTIHDDSLDKFIRGIHTK